MQTANISTATDIGKATCIVTDTETVTETVTRALTNTNTDTDRNKDVYRNRANNRYKSEEISQLQVLLLAMDGQIDQGKVRFDTRRVRSLERIVHEAAGDRSEPATKNNKWVPRVDSFRLHTIPRHLKYYPSLFRVQSLAIQSAIPHHSKCNPSPFQVLSIKCKNTSLGMRCFHKTK